VRELVAVFVGELSWNLCAFGSGPSGDWFVLNVSTLSWSSPVLHGLAPAPRFCHSLTVLGDFGSPQLLVVGGVTISPNHARSFVIDARQ
jgi:hypothetical protein